MCINQQSQSNNSYHNLVNRLKLFSSIYTANLTTMAQTLQDISSKFTEDVLDDIIKNSGGIKHTSWEFGGGFTKGDSMLSEVSRFFVHGVKENGDEITVKLVIKSLPRNIARRKTFRSTNFFENEINFYKHVSNFN